jgi:hypothetical protein
MLNVNMRLAEDRPHMLVIEVDLSQEHGESASGKSVIVASTQGNVPVPGDSGVMVGINVYRPVGRKKRE